MDLDPKGLNNQIKESIEKRFNAEDEDSLVRLSESGKWEFRRPSTTISIH